MASGPVAYNPYDPTQTSFLAALGLGESGSNKGYATGTGGADVSGYPTDSYGFPQWGGFGNSHAAGEFQFQPATWDAVAANYNLNFQNPADQNAGAWYLAQQTYAEKTGGSLTDALKSGDYKSVEGALASVWPSITGNGAAPGGLSGTMSNASFTGKASSFFDFLNPFQWPNVAKNIGAAAGDQFSRIALLAIGALIILVALWQLLSSTGAVPSPGSTAKAVARVAA